MFLSNSSPATTYDPFVFLTISTPPPDSDAEEDTINIIDNFIDAGNLLPASKVNMEMLRICGDRCSAMLEWLECPSRLTDVSDALGKVIDPNTTARGFPAWGDLLRKAPLTS